MDSLFSFVPLNKNFEPPKHVSRAKKVSLSVPIGERQCIICHTTETPVWRKAEKFDSKTWLCNACGLRKKKNTELLAQKHTGSKYNSTPHVKPSSPSISSHPISTKRHTSSLTLPKRPLTAFIIFAKENRPKVTHHQPKLSFGDTSKQLSYMWSSQSNESKEKYTKLASIDLARYQNEKRARLATEKMISPPAMYDLDSKIESFTMDTIAFQHESRASYARNSQQPLEQPLFLFPDLHTNFSEIEFFPLPTAPAPLPFQKFTTAATSIISPGPKMVPLVYHTLLDNHQELQSRRLLATTSSVCMSPSPSPFIQSDSLARTATTFLPMLSKPTTISAPLK